jgi:hypothetical protein
MANKTKATRQKEEAREKGPETPDAPLPLQGKLRAAMCQQGNANEIPETTSLVLKGLLADFHLLRRGGASR